MPTFPLADRPRKCGLCLHCSGKCGGNGQYIVTFASILPDEQQINQIDQFVNTLQVQGSPWHNTI